MAEQGKLGNIHALMQPMKTEYGKQTPVWCREGAQLSLQLAEVAYTFEMDPWRAEGWYDVSYHVDHTLLTGSAANGSGGLTGLISEYRQFMSRVRMKSANLINQVLGTVRNREESDTLKAVVMIHPGQWGQYLVAIGFMGTGKRVYDWLANFRIDNEDGMHQGCLQLTKRFEENLGDIQFDETARALNMEKLTLMDILEECKQGNSRFKIWMAGHSQGGAVMQLFAYRLLRQGVLRKNLIGYSFAAPSVLYGPGKMDTQSVPLFHLINRDDLVPRLGAQLHLGQCYIFSPTDAQRQRCYGHLWQSEEYKRAFRMIAQVQCTEEAMVLLMSLCRALQELSDEDTVSVASELVGRFLPERMLALLGGRMEDGLKMLLRYVERSYRKAVSGVPLPEGRIALWQKKITDEMDAIGPRAFIKCLLQVMGIPHRLRYKASYGDTVPVYAYMTKEGFEDLRRGLLPRYAARESRNDGERQSSPGRFGYARRRQNVSARRRTR